MATSAALMQSQLSTLQKMNKEMHIRRKRKRKAFKSDKALSGAEVEGMVKQE
jgi:hypothetical protein